MPAASDALDDRLGRIAIARGLVSAGELELCIAQLGAARSAVQLAQQLVRRGLVGAADLSRLLREAQQGGISCPACGAVNAVELAVSFRPRHCTGCRATLVEAPRAREAAGPSRLGRYEVVREIARGGMGVIYLARDEALGRDVALKVLRADAGEQQVARLQREATLAGRLNHPAIIPIHDVGCATRDDGSPIHFIAMDYVDGPTLGDAMATLALSTRLELLEEIARAVGFAHARGVIHRDLKPANILITRDGRPIVTDFGLARGADDASLTQSGAVMGTVHYMAPEQVLGLTDQIDARSDVWALGVMMYELLVDRRPFGGRTAAEVYQAILDDEPAAPQRVAPDGRTIDSELELVCLKALEKDPSRRYAEAAELAEDLERHRLGEPIRAVPPSRLYLIHKYFQRHPWRLTFLLVALVATVLGLWWVGQSRYRWRDHLWHAQSARRAFAAGAWRDALLAGERALATDDTDAELVKLVADARRALADEQRLKEAELQRAIRYEALQHKLAPYSRKVESTRTLFYVRHLDIGAKLREVELALGELETVLAAPDHAEFADGWLLLGAGWSLAGVRGPALAALEAACQRAAPGEGEDPIAAEAAFALGRTLLEEAMARERLIGLPLRWHEVPLSPPPESREALRARARSLLDSAAAHWPADRAAERPMVELARALAAGDAEAVRAIARPVVDDPVRSRQLGGEAFRAALGHVEAEQALAHWSVSLESEAHYLHSSWLRFLRGSEHHRRGDTDAALADYDKALAISPRRAEVLHNRGVVQAARNERAAAQRDLELCAAVAPEWDEPCRAIGALALSAGQPAQATRWLVEATRRDPRSWSSWILLYEARVAQGDEAGKQLARQQAEACATPALLEVMRRALR